MASTYTINGGIELITTGEQSGTWGTTTNTNLQIIDRLTNGVGAISLSGTTHTLATTDGTLSDGQYSVLVFGGSPSGTNTVTISPNDAQHVYFVKNSSGQSVVLTQGSGGNVTVANGKSAIVYADGAGAGAEVVDVTDTFDFQPLTATLTAIGALAVTDGNFIVGDGSTWVAENGATARTSLGLGSIATQAANSVSITGGSITGITDLAVADGGTGASTAANARTNLGLAIGTNVQAWDVNLDQIAALAVTDGNFIVGNGSAWVAESGATARTSLGLGTIATQAANNVSITGGSITGITDLAVADGGTGVSTTPTNGQLLIGNGSGYTVSTLTAGTGVSVTNGSGTVTIAATNNGTVTSVATGTGLTGGTITTTGTVSVATNGITNTLLRDSGALSVIGRSANSTGDPADISAGTDHQVLRRSGTTLGFGAIALNQAAAVTGTLPVARGGTGITSLGAGVATWLATPSSANLAAAVTGETGSGALVFATSPTLVTPVLGTPTSGNLSNCTADGTNAVGFKNIPQNSRSAAYTLVLGDAGKHILHPSADTTARTFTIPANSSVAYPIGTAITFVNQNGAGVVTIAITTDTMRLAGDGSTGSRTLAANGVATCIKITSTEWIISGVGLT